MISLKNDTFTGIYKPSRSIVDTIPLQNSLEGISNMQCNQTILQRLDQWKVEIEFLLEEFETLNQLLHWSKERKGRKKDMEPSLKFVDRLECCKNKIITFRQKCKSTLWRRGMHINILKREFSTLREEVETIYAKAKIQKKALLKQLVVHFPMSIW